MTNAFTINRLAEAARIEFWNRDLARAESRGREHAGKVSDVKNWSCVKIHASLCVAHPEVEVLDVGEDIGVRHHHALGMTGGAACVDKS
jgi:hypothetical protein